MRPAQITIPAAKLPNETMIASIVNVLNNMQTAHDNSEPQGPALKSEDQPEPHDR